MQKQNKHRLEPISFYPLKPEDVLRAFIKVDPERVKKAMKKEGIIRLNKSALPTG